MQGAQVYVVPVFKHSRDARRGKGTFLWQSRRDAGGLTRVQSMILGARTITRQNRPCPRLCPSLPACFLSDSDYFTILVRNFISQ